MEMLDIYILLSAFALNTKNNNIYKHKLKMTHLQFTICDYHSSYCVQCYSCYTNKHIWELLIMYYKSFIQCLYTGKLWDL